MNVLALLSPRRSLRRRVIFASAGGVLVAVTALALTLWLNDRAQSELFDATDSFIEEQAIADGIYRSVMRQLLAASAMQAGVDTVAVRDLLKAGDDAYEQLRLYLFRDLTTQERLQLERVKEAQQLLEVSAVRAIELRRGDEASAGAEAFESVLANGFSLLDAVSAFLHMREEGLLALRERQIRSFRVVYAGGVALAVLLLLGAVAVGRLLQHAVATPLADLTRAADRIADGDLKARVPDTHVAEFSALAGSFNHMAERLRELRADLERRNRELSEALERVHDTRDELLKSEKLSTVGRMTAGLVHELNGPLASVLGYGELLEEELAGGSHPTMDEIQKDYLGPIVEEARRAHHLARNLLVFSRRGDAAVGPTSLDDAVTVALRLRSFEFEGAGLSLEVENVEGVHVIAERQRLQEAILNILNNALHALKAGSGTGLRIYRIDEADEVVLRFDDDGPGFSDPDLALEPFFTTKPPDEGTGLGLALVYRYMKEFSGSVRIGNRPEGGARVELRFRPAETVTAVDSSVQQDPPSAGKPTRIDEPLPSDRNPRVLVVDDDAHLRVIHQRILVRAGATVALAAEVGEAKEILDAQDFDLVISDVRMPGEDGLDLRRWVLANHPGLEDRFLFVSGDTESPETLSLAEAHPDLFLRKPFQMSEYLGRVRAMLG